MKNFYALILCLLFSVSTVAQHQDAFYATMALRHAKALTKDAPNEIEILATYRNEAAVFMTTIGSHKLHNRILTHGPGYIFRNSKEEAISAIQSQQKRTEKNTRAALNFSITEDATVNPTLDLIHTQNIADHILELENYGTRHHNRAGGTQAAIDLKEKWETMAANYGRTDVSVRLFEHANTDMPSVILTITGAELPDEYVIVGGHLDSTSNQGNVDNAPGADDDASGIATITEATRALFEIEFVPKRTIEVMAYAAEEIGLVGSNEIATEYAANAINVVAVSQFDMTLFNGSTNDVSFITDFTSEELTSYMMSLLDHYNASGPHQVTYSTSVCNYGCSDHASWTGQGYMAAFPFEANFGQHNSNIHTTGDVFSLTNTASHATKFAKLCAEFLIEVAKNNEVLAVNDVLASSIYATIQDGILSYDFTASQKEVTSIQLYSIKGQEVYTTTTVSERDQVTLPTLSTGVYIAMFNTENNTTPIVKKLIVN